MTNRLQWWWKPKTVDGPGWGADAGEYYIYLHPRPSPGPLVFVVDIVHGPIEANSFDYRAFIIEVDSTDEAKRYAETIARLSQ